LALIAQALSLPPMPELEMAMKTRQRSTQLGPVRSGSLESRPNQQALPAEPIALAPPFPPEPRQRRSKYLQQRAILRTQFPRSFLIQKT